MRSKIYPRLWAILLLSAQVSFAQSDSASAEISSAIFNLSLEDLMEMKVTTASKSEEKIQEAPAIISVMGSKEIEGFGAMNLAELLDRLTSTYLVSTSFAPLGMLTIRGKQTEHYNTNVLILIDGRPLRESFHNGYNGVIYSMFPVSSLERIEIIRGPGSVLYGTNAYVGVINLITKSGNENAIRGSIRYGSYNTKQLMISAQKTLNELKLQFGVNALQTDGWNFTAVGEDGIRRNMANTADSVLNAQTIQRDNKGIGSTLKASYKGITLNAFAATNDWATMNRVTSWPKPLDYRIQNNRLFADLGYQKEVTKEWTISANMTYNLFEFRSYSPGQKDDLTRRGSNDMLFEITNYLKPSEKINIVIGGLTNMQTGKGVQPDLTATGQAYNLNQSKNPNPWITVPYYDLIWNSAYFQADYAPVKFIKVIAGGQANKITGFRTDLVPRVGTILTITNNLGIKLLYGQAFRAASAFERSSYSPPSVYGNPMLTPEKITTYETQVFFIKSKLDVSATYFYNHDGNKISRASVRDTLLFGGSGVPFSQKYVNTGHIITQGLELEAKFKIAKVLQLFSSATYQKSIDNLSRKDYDGMPTFMCKIGILYNYKEKLNIGAFGSYFGSGGSIYRYNASGALLTKVVNPNANPYNDISLNVSANLKNIFGLQKMPDLSLQCYVTNLLDEKIYYQEVVRRNINSLPGRPGRTINVGIAVRF